MAMQIAAFQSAQHAGNAEPASAASERPPWAVAPDDVAGPPQRTRNWRRLLTVHPAQPDVPLQPRQAASREASAYQWPPTYAARMRAQAAVSSRSSGSGSSLESASSHSTSAYAEATRPPHLEGRLYSPTDASWEDAGAANVRSEGDALPEGYWTPEGGSGSTNDEARRVSVDAVQPSELRVPRHRRHRRRYTRTAPSAAALGLRDTLPGQLDDGTPATRSVRSGSSTGSASSSSDGSISSSGGTPDDGASDGARSRRSYDAAARPYRMPPSRSRPLASSVLPSIGDSRSVAHRFPWVSAPFYDFLVQSTRMLLPNHLRSAVVQRTGHGEAGTEPPRQSWRIATPPAGALPFCKWPHADACALPCDALLCKAVGAPREVLGAEVIETAAQARCGLLAAIASRLPGVDASCSAVCSVVDALEGRSTCVDMPALWGGR